MPTTRKRDTQPIVHTRNTRSRLSTSTSTSTASFGDPDSRSKSPEKRKEVKMTIPVLPRDRSVELRGVKAWERDYKALRVKWKKGKIEGYGGLIAEISGTSKKRSRS